MASNPREGVQWGRRASTGNASLRHTPAESLGSSRHLSRAATTLGGGGGAASAVPAGRASALDDDDDGGGNGDIAGIRHSHIEGWREEQGDALARVDQFPLDRRHRLGGPFGIGGARELHRAQQRTVCDNGRDVGGSGLGRPSHLHVEAFERRQQARGACHGVGGNARHGESRRPQRNGPEARTGHVSANVAAVTTAAAKGRQDRAVHRRVAHARDVAISDERLQQRCVCGRRKRALERSAVQLQPDEGRRHNARATQDADRIGVAGFDVQPEAADRRQKPLDRRRRPLVAAAAAAAATTAAKVSFVHAPLQVCRARRRAVSAHPQGERPEARTGPRNPR